MLWSIGNELVLAARAGRRRATSSAAARHRQATGPDAPGRPGASPATRPPAARPRLRAARRLGVNEYFGWYPGPSGQIFDRTLLSGLPRRACAPATRTRRIVVTEFGAEANRDGPVEEKGTWAFQQDFVNYHLGVFAHQAVAERRDLLGAERVLRAPGLGGRQPAPAAAVAPEGPDHLRRRRASRRGPTCSRWYTPTPAATCRPRRS